MVHVINTASVTGIAAQHSRAFAPICTNSVVLTGHTQRTGKGNCVKSVHGSEYEVTQEHCLAYKQFPEIFDFSHISCFCMFNLLKLNTLFIFKVKIQGLWAICIFHHKTSHSLYTYLESVMDTSFLNGDYSTKLSIAVTCEKKESVMSPL